MKKIFNHEMKVKVTEDLVCFITIKCVIDLKFRKIACPREMDIPISTGNSLK